MSGFAALHVPGDPLLLVNGWDVLSVLALDDAGHPAIGTTSLGITAAAGLPDGDRRGLDLTLELLDRLAGRVGAYLTVDLEDGFDDDPRAVAHLVADVASRGVAGVNLEDGGRDADRHTAIVRAVKDAVPDVFVNARTDVFWSGTRDLTDALERLRAYRDAGADGLFVPGLFEPVAVAQVVALGLPVNVLWRDGVDLSDQGVARVSTGSALYRRALGAALQLASPPGGPDAPDLVDYAWTQSLLSP